MRKIVFVLLFSLLSVLAVLYFEYKKDNFVVEHLHSRTEQLNLLYDSLYSEYKKVSNMIYDTQINRDDVIAIFKQTKRADDKEKSLLREELYNHLKEKYLLYKKYGVKQLHFHLSDNSSFLRFHRPKMFGDDLSRFRPTIAYVNRYKKAIDGYEEGKIFSGYRFVYPLFDETIGYIGSVEVSFGMLSMTKEIIEHFNIPANFLIAKSVVDAKVVNGEKSNYVSSSFSDYYFEKDILANFKKEFSMQERKLISEASKATFYANIGKGDTFSIFDEKSSNIITFIPVQNPINKIIIGAISVRGDARYIEERISEFYQLATIAIIVIFLVLHIIYRELFYRDEMIKRNKNLSDKVKEEVKKNIKKEKTMLHQSRLAQMGEMLSMIAHQWRQPLSAISATSADLGMKTMLNKYEKNIFREKLGNIAEYSQHLSKTIDDFRDFYKSNKEKRSVLLGDVFLGALSIVESSMVNKNIKIKKEFTCHDSLMSYPNELKQVVLNLIKNAEDALVEKDVENPTIVLKTARDKEFFYLVVSDNAGGVPKDKIEKIFEPYYTTKEKKDGTGLGLYMSKMIIQDHCGGLLEVENSDVGAVFSVKIPFESKDKR